MLSMVVFLLFICLGVTFLRLRNVLQTHKQIPKYNGIYPSVSIIRPVKGLDVGAEDNFRAALNTRYPGEVETIFVFDGKNDPAYHIALKVVENFASNPDTGRVTLIVAGPPKNGCTGKLHAMIAGQKCARNELIAFSDSDTRPDKNVLRILVETLLSTTSAGSSFIPVVIDQPIKKAGDVFYALMQNVLYAPWALMALGKSRELPFIMGQYMVFTRECLNAIGGVECAQGQLVDDMYIGKCVAKAG
jgi:ceramide glucosyltransferase